MVTKEQWKNCFEAFLEAEEKKLKIGEKTENGEKEVFNGSDEKTDILVAKPL